MSYDNSAPAIPTHIADAAFFAQAIENLKWLRGQAPGQTESALRARLSVPSPIISAHADRFDIVRRFSNAELAAGGDAKVAAIDLAAEDQQDPSSIADGRFCAMRGVLQEEGGDAQDLVSFLASRLAERSGVLLIAVLGTEDPDITVDPITGYVGLELAGLLPEVPLDVGRDVNVSGVYRKNGIELPDWTKTSGTPDEVEWAGPARVLRTWKIGVAPGTPALVLDGGSQTLATNVNVEKMGGHGWHNGIIEFAETQHLLYTSDADDVTLDLDGRAGEWSIYLVLTAYCPDTSDVGETVNVKIKDGAGAQLGETRELSFSDLYGAECVLLSRAYTSVTGTETIKATIAIPTSSEVADLFTDAALAAVWEGP